MHDTISRYRTLRLSVHLRRDGKTVDWTLLATRTWNGVPNSKIVLSGTAVIEEDLDTEEGCIRAMSAITQESFR